MASLARMIVLAGALSVGASVVFVPACSKPPAPERRTPDATYTVRGKVTALPDPAKKGSELRVQHEAIDDFRDRNGKVVGMGSMVMEFPPAPGVRIDKLKVGDIVELTFSVWWGETPPWEATRIVTLPADTKLEFHKANPPKPAAPDAPAADPAAVPAPAPGK